MKLLVLSGGRHPYQESTPVLGAFLRTAGSRGDYYRRRLGPVTCC